jgi:hypothetical protein
MPTSSDRADHPGGIGIIFEIENPGRYFPGGPAPEPG